jgi:hypothetical protein
VNGFVLVGRERLAVTGAGSRRHTWGERDWWTTPDSWVGGRLDDGTAVLAADARIEVDGRGLVAGGSCREARLRAVYHAPIQVPSPDGRLSRLARALCLLETDDGRSGWAWAERLQPA